jgi:hypothetical protein
MVPGRPLLIVVMPLIDMNLLYQTQFLECLQGTINGGQAEARVLFPGPAIDFIGIQVPPPLLYYLQYQKPLVSNSQPRYV